MAEICEVIVAGLRFRKCKCAIKLLMQIDEHGNINGVWDDWQNFMSNDQLLLYVCLVDGERAADSNF